MSEIHIIACFKCKVYMNIIGSWYLGGHCYCEKDKPEGSVKVKINDVLDSTTIYTAE